MDFRDLYEFNRALLGKQAWRILQNPQSLLSKIYKGRYYNSSTFLESRNVSLSSYGWRSIQVGKELVKKGISTLIGDGRSTNVWRDHWLPVIPPRRLGYVVQDPHMTVSELIDSDTRKWNVHRLQMLLDPGDVELVRRIRLSMCSAKDQIIWPFAKNLRYSVKSGYWAATHVLRSDIDIVPPGGSVNLKLQCWKINILPKIKSFLLKLLSGALATYAQLCTRGVKVNPTCQRCCVDDETINHVLFQCPYVFAVWRSSGLPLSSQFTQELEVNIATLLEFMNDNKEEPQLCLLPFWILWSVWKSRNEFLFSRRNVQPIDDFRRAVISNEEWNHHVKYTTLAVAPRVPRCSYWEPPLADYLKCNFDCSFSREEEFAGLGWIIRDSTGLFVSAGSASVQGVISNLDGEAHAFLYGLQMVWSRGLRRVWFEGDNAVLTQIINTSSDDLELGSLLVDIRFWLQKLPLCSLDHVNRERNQAADCLAKKAHEHINCLSRVYSVPPV